MSLIVGARLGPYEIRSPLGVGGMGEVYRARDTKLNRDVALKVLPDSFANDPDRLARFQREAQVLASLNHPNIAHIHGLEDSGGVRALVMELVEGEDLAQRLTRGAIPIDEALPIAKQIAEALEAAHEQGIIHRDLKPANIKVRADGTVKVLDFGLAKAMDPPVSSPDVSQSPTITTPAMTQAGMILGTAAYMSPEQAKGRAVDRRTDVWAFGTVLYEMLSGRRAFAGEDISDTLANVLKTEPDWSRLPADVWPRVRLVLRACLQKDPRQRPGDVQSVRLALDGAFETTGRQEAALVNRPGFLRRVAAVAVATAIAGGMIAGAAAWVTARRFLPEAVKAHVISFDVSIPLGMRWSLGRGMQFAVSPDDRQVAVILADTSGIRRLFIRALDAVTFREVTTNGEPTSVSWSPDSRYLAYINQERALLQVDVNSGLSEEITRVPCTNAFGAQMAWQASTGLVLSCSDGPLYQVSPGQTIARVLTTPGRDPNEQYYRPSLLPNGLGLLFTRRADNPAVEVTMVQTFDKREPRVVTSGEGAYSAGFVVFARGDALYAQPFDAARLEPTLAPRPLGIPVYRGNVRDALFSVNDAGTLLVLPGLPESRTQFAWYDRQGGRGAIVGPDGNYGGFDISDLGDRVVASGGSSAPPGLLVFDDKPAALKRLTLGDQFDGDPNIVGGTVYFVRRGGKSPGLYQIPIDGGAERQLRDGTVVSLDDVTNDGQRVAFRKGGSNLQAWAWSVPSKVDEPAASATAPVDQVHFSPDGSLVAYNTAADGRRQEVYVGTYPATSARWPISTSGGVQPIWRSDGKELFYLGLDGSLYAVGIEADGAQLKSSAPRALFKTPLRDFSASVEQYRATADGQRFLFKVPVGDDIQPPLRVIMNWPGLLEK